MTSATLADAYRQRVESDGDVPKSLAEAMDRASAWTGSSTLDKFMRDAMRSVERAVERRLTGMYDRLAWLESRPTSPNTEVEIRRALRIVRDLEHAEAERMRAYFEKHRCFDPDAAERALDEARELIRRHDHPA